MLLTTEPTVQETESIVLESFLSQMNKQDLDAYKKFKNAQLEQKVVEDFFEIFKDMLSVYISNQNQLILSTASLCRTIRNKISAEAFLTPEEAEKIMLKKYFN